MKKERIMIIIILILGFVIFFSWFWGVFGYQLKYSQPYREGVEYYSDGSYSKFGFGISRYGRIASEYLPEYEEISENALDIQFVYSGGWGYTNTVDAFVAVKYDEETYTAKRTELLAVGQDFGCDDHIGDVDARHHRIMDQKRMFNGDYVYYVITCCDKDNLIMYSAMFDHDEHTDMGSLSIHSHPYYEFFRENHTKCLSPTTSE